MGGLYTIMSILGSIGFVMNNSGLEEALETVYAKNTIEHMSGKIIYCAIQGHFMVDAVLNRILSKELKPLENLATDSDLDTNDPTQNLSWNFPF